MGNSSAMMTPIEIGGAAQPPPNRGDGTCDLESSTGGIPGCIIWRTRSGSES